MVKIFYKYFRNLKMYKEINKSYFLKIEMCKILMLDQLQVLNFIYNKRV